MRYKTDCEELYGRVLDNSNVSSSVNGTSKSQTETLWRRLYPTEPYDLDLINKATSETERKHTTTAYDLVSAVKRQSPFYYQISRPHVDNDVFLQEAVARYKAFLYLIKRNRERSVKLFCVPTYDIDLIWHTHQLHAQAYCNDMAKMIGKVLEHDDTDSDRSKGKKLDTGFSGTTAMWEETFGTRYWKAGAMNRGNTPKAVTASPCGFLGKKLITAEEDVMVIQSPEVDVIEVVLEIVGVKNLPDAYKGKVFVVFSKTQPDSLFNAERKLSILSESCGEKQVAMFKCEPRGELRFQVMSSKSKALGFVSLSLSEFLFPVSRLSVEKWLDLTTPAKRGKDPISLRVAVSFTPPTPSPTVLHMVQTRPSLKDSCFFPLVGKARLAKVFTRVVDENETEVMSLQMRNSIGDARQVIGEKGSGESLVMAEYDESYWSLLDCKWSLKQIRSGERDGPLFEIMGDRMVKVYSGRKLEYEPKHCVKLRSEQDFFMTAVEFSKEHPYGKAVGLLDLKTGSIEVKYQNAPFWLLVSLRFLYILICMQANERWFVLVGVVSAFILSDLLKKEGSLDKVKANGIKEETEVLTDQVKVGEETMMNVDVTNPVLEAAEKVNGGAKCYSKELNASGGCGVGCGVKSGNITEEEGGHCGGCGGCGGGSGCSGGGGRCGGVTKVSGCGGGSCGGGSCGNCSGGCGNMIKSNANEDVPLAAPEALNDAVTA